MALAFGVVGAAGCAGLIGADFDRELQASGGSSGDDDAGNADTSVDDDRKDADGRAPVTPDAGRSYAAAQTTLEARRTRGPSTGLSSHVTCTPNRVVWRDPDDALHSWQPSDGRRIDYSFRPCFSIPFYPSDAFIVGYPTQQGTPLYRAGAPNDPFDTLPVGQCYMALEDGVLSLDRRGSPDNTVVQRWSATKKTWRDVSPPLATRQNASSIVGDILILPGSVNVPTPLFVVNVATGTSSSVIFDNAVGLDSTVTTSAGLYAAYSRAGSKRGLRLYPKLRDQGRVEIGAEVALHPNLFEDSLKNEHEYFWGLAAYESYVIYAAPTGIYAYDLDKDDLVALQLARVGKHLLPNVLCVLAGTGTLIYREFDDDLGRLWAVPLSGLLDHLLGAP